MSVDVVRDRVPDVRRMAVLRAGAIGDFLMVVPALEALRRCYADAEIVVLGDAWLPDLLRARPGPWDAVVVVPLYPGLRGCPSDAAPGEQVEEFFARHAGSFDVALQMHGGGRNSNPFVRRLRPRVSAGARSPDAEPLDRWVPYVTERPEALRWLEVAELVGAAGLRSLDDVTPRLTVTQDDVDASRALLPEDDPFVLLHVGARDARRRWPASKFTEVARSLARRYAVRVVLVGSQADRPASAQVAEGLGAAAVDLTGQLSLGPLLGLACRSVLMVGNDSGPRHLAASAGAPTVGVFWAANLLTFGPLVGGGARAVTSYTAQCPTCGVSQSSHQCGHDASLVDSVSVEEVLGAASDLLATDPRARSAARRHDGSPAGSAGSLQGSPIR